MSEWVQTLDASSGKFYYYNKATRDTTWVAPPTFKPARVSVSSSAADAEAAKKAAEASANAASKSASEGEWKEVLEKGTGKPYYYNRVTRETRWDPPASYIPATRPASDTVAPGVPAAAAAPAAAPVVAPVTPAVDDNDDSNWREASDPASGKKYYYNKKTKVTMWEDPRKNKPTESTAAAKPAAAPSPAPSPSSSTPAVTISPAASAGVAKNPKYELESDDEDEEEPEKLPSSAGTQDKASNEPRMELHRFATTEPGEKVKDTKDYRKIMEDEELKDGGKDDDEFNFLFAKHRHGWFARTFRTGEVLDASKIMSFKKSLIKKALLKQNRHLDQEAVQCFKNIMSYMGDRESSKEGLPHAQKLLRNVMAAPSGLRDEALLQMCKQVTGNPRGESTILGWELIHFALCAFPPSKPLKKFLLAFLQENIEGKEKQHSEATLEIIRNFAKQCLENLPKIMTLGQRKEVPSIQELECSKKVKGVNLRIHLIDGSHKTLTVDPFTLVSDVVDALNKKLNLTCTFPFSLFEMRNSERVIGSKERILDIIAAWEHVQTQVHEESKDPKDKDKEKEKEKEKQNVKDYKLLFKARLVLKQTHPELKNDQEARNLLYAQCVHDVITSRYPVKDTHVPVLAALQLQATFGDYQEEVHGRGWLLDKLHQFVPPSFLVPKDNKKEDIVSAEWEQKVIAKYEKLKGFSAVEAKGNYLDYVQQWPVYGVSMFIVEQRQFKDYPSPLILGITCEGALLMHPENKQILDNHKYTDIVTWGHSEEKFILVVGNVIQQRKIVLKTDEGAVINQLVHDYVKAKVAPISK